MRSPRVIALTQPSGDATLVQFHFTDAPELPDVPAAEFRGSLNSCCLMRLGRRRVLHVGLGEREQFHIDRFRQAAGVAVKSLLKIGAEILAFDLRAHSDRVEAVVEGVLLGAYKFEDFKSKESRRKFALKTVQVWVSAPRLKMAQEQALAGSHLANATNFTRQIGNLPPNVLTPKTLAQEAQALARRLGIKCRVWDERALKREGFGGILAVGQGSANPPRFIVLESPCSVRNAPTVAVVGKAITFDTGGISIKPADRMEEMKWDKMGGCAVLGIVQAVRELRLPIRLIGLIPSAENMPSSTAYRPSDLITAWDGKTIEVLNTDAEGRVVLADALAYARDQYHPDLTVDLATLTGACVVALGGRRAGLFTVDERIRGLFFSVGEDTGDRVWPLPMGEEYAEQIQSDVALVKNTGGREGGACTAASFLQHWSGDGPWVHLDIAGPAMGLKELPLLEKGATGFGVRLITEFLRRHGSQLQPS